MDVLSSLRQLRFHPEFRIAPYAPPTEAAEEIERLAATVRELEARLGSETVASVGDEPPEALTAIATDLWRLRGRLVDPDTGEPREETRRAFRYLRSVWDTLEESGVRIVDHTGEPFDPGRRLSAAAFQPTAGLAREVVLETLRPSVYYHEQQVQMGEVIVGTPDETAGTGASS
jgi:hypothetical protein